MGFLNKKYQKNKYGQDVEGYFMGTPFEFSRLSRKSKKNKKKYGF